MISAGIDIGSRATKLVLVRDDRVVREVVLDSGPDPLAVCAGLLDGIAYDVLVATGYGRHLVQGHLPGVRVVSEIKAVATGAVWRQPGCRTVVDVGGQDTKVVSIDPAGRVGRFAMNDRCAAGTGQFLETMAASLGLPDHGLSEAAARATQARRLTSMCAVFARSEVVGLVARGVPREEIALGVLLAVASRTASLAGTIPVEDPVVFTGGCAVDERFVALVSSALGHRMIVPESPRCVAALGCALLGSRQEDRP